jgi:hypothetical protein
MVVENAFHPAQDRFALVPRRQKKNSHAENTGRRIKTFELLLTNQCGPIQSNCRKMAHTVGFGSVVIGFLCLFAVRRLLKPRRVLKSDEFGGKVVWITGASSGIGKSLALVCAKYGAKLVRNKGNIDFKKHNLFSFLLLRYMFSDFIQ